VRTITRRLFIGGLAWLGLTARLAGQATGAGKASSSPADTDWRHYGGDLASTRYAPLDQINGSNFNDLDIAWRFKFDNFGPQAEYKYEATPLVTGGILYTTGGTRRTVVAINAISGELLWLYRIDEGVRAQKSPRRLSGHGVSYWSDGDIARILFVTVGYQLVSLDARTGLPDPDFGHAGIVDLKLNDDQQIGPDNDDIGLHSTPCVCRNVVIVGAAHSTGFQPPHHANVKGYVRGFDVRSGKRLWIFHTIPRPGELGYDSWPKGTETIGNGGVWAQISADAELGLAYLPVELPTGDINGEFRPGDGLFGETIVAVDVLTGERRWHYQTIHHGLWDYDVPAAPILVDLPMHGGVIKELAQPTKQAFLYVLDRTNGRPIWPIVERPVPQGDVPRETYSRTQPIPTRPPPFDLQGIGIKDLIDFTPELRAEATALVRNYRVGPLYTPPSVATADGTWGTLLAPGAIGGANWPGGAYDPDTHRLYVFSQTNPTVFSLFANENKAVSDFGYLPVETTPKSVLVPRGHLNPGDLTVEGLPLVRPPWGRITAIDLTNGSLAWQVAHGETPDEVRHHPRLKGLTIPRTGRTGMLGVLVTKSLVICGEAGVFTAPDGRGAMMRAYDKDSGAEKGAVYMPAPQSGSPMTYMAKGRQYIVVAISGGTYPAELLAYRLPAV